MIEALARVEACADGRVTVSWQSQSACGHCHEADTCGSGVVAKAVAAKAQRLTLTYGKPLSVGTQVSLGIPEQQLITAAALVYLLPLLGLLLGAGLGSVWGGPEWLSLLAGIGLAIGGFLLARGLSHRFTPTPRILRVLGVSTTPG